MATQRHAFRDGRFWTTIAVLALGALVAASSAEASICICVNPKAPALRVNAKGFAEVSWRAGTVRRYVVITPRGRLLPDVRMKGRDVSVGTKAVWIRLKEVLRRTPDGAFWALQRWRRTKDGPLELHFARWRGKPTRLTVEAVCCARGREGIRGVATFHKRPIYRASVYIDCFACSLNRRGWARATRLVTRRDGSYRAWLRQRSRGERYRVTMVGPNVGWTRAPDARALAASDAP